MDRIADGAEADSSSPTGGHSVACGRDGRRLALYVAGDPDAMPLVLHHGTPGAALPYPPLVDAVTSRGLRYVAYSRPGYAGSTPEPGRSVADAAADVTDVLDHLGVGEFVTAGWSGGGPHALACAESLPGRCLAAAIVAGVAPHDAEGLDWTADMGAENLAEFGAAVAGEAELDPWLRTAAAPLEGMQPADAAAALGDLASAIDRSVLVGPFAEWLTATFRAGVGHGIDGWRDDDLAFVRPWNVNLADIVAPVTVWHGDHDRMVPVGHGRWLAAHVAGSRTRELPGEGHLSVLVNAFDQVVDELLAR